MEGFIQPEMVVVSENMLVPARNFIMPRPNQFTHEITWLQQYYYTGAQQATPPDGQFQAGTKVVLLLYDGGNYCRVVDERGLYVEVEFNCLKKLI